MKAERQKAPPEPSDKVASLPEARLISITDGGAVALDYALHAGCLASPDVIYNPAELSPEWPLDADYSGRIPVDVDRDGNVDLADFAGVQIRFAT